jgi:2-oxoglutarate dehydrogenase E1 component
MSGIISRQKEWILGDLIEALETAYCGKIGVEYMHIPHIEELKWIRNKFELFQYNQYDKEKRTHILDRLLWTDGFAKFISVKFNTMKRFGLEGVESFIPGMKAMIDRLKDDGAHKVIIGMPHRGRLNMLANVIRKPTETIFAEFQGVMPT